MDFYSSYHKKVMENDQTFPEQKAPEKNTDNAFVQVGEDGKPVNPAGSEKKTDIEKEDGATTLDKR